MNLLIDTCTNRIILAIFNDSTVFSFCNEIIENQMSNIIMEKLENCFIEANIEPSEINRILVASGPGSYTGIRIGVTIAKTYAWALKKEIVPISSIEVMVSGYNENKLLVSYIDARRNAVFAGIYDNNLKPILKDQYILFDELKDKVKDKEFILISDNCINKPKIDVIKILKKYACTEGMNPHSLNPTYLKNTEAEEKIKND